MILLDGHSLGYARKVPLEAHSMQLKERESTATISPADMTGIGVNSWFLDEKDPGAGTVWRVRSISTAYATNTPTIQLEHVISILKDTVLFGEVTPATITGNKNAKTCTAEQAVRYILSKSDDWTLGGVGYSVSNPYKFDGDTLFDALETVTDSLDDACWTYDLSRYPFRLYINPFDSSVGSEMRAGRNMRTITRTVDRSGMYTRFYPIGADDLHISGEYVSRHENTYGVIGHIETDSSIDTESELRRWANERLKKHADPVVTIEVDGLELSASTGEPLDKMNLLRACRCPLPEYGTTIQERITALNYQDKLFQPELVRVTLANNRTDVTRIIADNMKKGGKSARTSTKKSKEDHAWFEDTNDHVAMCAEAIIGVDADGKPNWTRMSQIIVDGTGIHATVQSIQKDVVKAQSSIEQNEKAIKAEVTRAVDAESQLKGQLIVEAGRVGMLVEKTDNREVLYFPVKDYFPKTGSSQYWYLETSTGTYWEWKNGRYQIGTGPGAVIAAANITTAINESTGETEAIIDAQKVYIGNSKSTTVINGKLNVNDLSSEISKLDYVTTKSLSAKKFWLYDSPDETTTSVNVASTALRTAALTRSGNTYYLHLYAIDGTECVSTRDNAMSFSRATTLSGAWSSGTLTVSASPQGNTITFGLFDTVSADVSWTNNTAKVKVYANVDGGETKYNTGKVLQVDCTARYTAGYQQGQSDYYTSNYWSKPSTNNTWYVRRPKSDVSGTENYVNVEPDITVDSTAHTSRGSRTQIFSNVSTFQNQSWYYFDVKVDGKAKQYAIYVKTS